MIMAKFLNSSGITHYLENLIKNTNKSLFLISPYIKFNSKIKQFLGEKNKEKHDIRVIYGKKDLQNEESNWLNSMDSIKVLFCKNLHAKCYMNEKEAIINMTNDLHQEKRAITRIWTKREKQIDQVVGGVVGMYGGMQGIIGSSLPEINSLSMPELIEDQSKNKKKKK